MNLALDWLNKNSREYPSEKDFQLLKNKMFSQSKLVSYRSFLLMLKLLSSECTELFKIFHTEKKHCPSKIHLGDVPSIFSKSLFDLEITPIPSVNLGELIEPETIKEWIFFFKSFIPRNIKLDGSDMLIPEEWASSGLSEFSDYISKHFENLDPFIYDQIFDSLNAISIKDLPMFSIYTPYFTTGENMRMAEELNYLLAFILRDSDDIGLKDEFPQWLREKGYGKLLEAEQPPLFKRYYHLFTNFISKLKKLKYIDCNQDWVDFLITCKTDEVDDPCEIYVPYVRRAVLEAEGCLRMHGKLLDLFQEILNQPYSGLVYQFIHPDYGDNNDILLNKANGQRIDDFSEKEELFWEIFFAHHFPQHCSTSWVLIKEQKDA